MKRLTDDKMWEIAENRVGFRRHLVIYLVINILIIALWYFTSYRYGSTAGYWFIYPLLGWGIGLAFHYWGAYWDDLGAVENEYKKIRGKYGLPTDEESASDRKEEGA